MSRASEREQHRDLLAIVNKFFTKAQALYDNSAIWASTGITEIVTKAKAYKLPTDYPMDAEHHEKLDLAIQSAAEMLYDAATDRLDESEKWWFNTRPVEVNQLYTEIKAEIRLDTTQSSESKSAAHP